MALNVLDKIIYTYTLVSIKMYICTFRHYIHTFVLYTLTAFLNVNTNHVTTMYEKYVEDINHTESAMYIHSYI